MVSILMLGLLAQHFQAVQNKEPIRAGLEYYAVCDQKLYMTQDKRIVSWDLQSGQSEIIYPKRGGSFGTIVCHNKYLVSCLIGFDGHYHSYIFVKGEVLSYSKGSFYRYMFSANGRLFLSPNSLEPGYLMRNPFPFMVKEAKIIDGAASIIPDGIQFGKLSERHRDLDYNHKAIYIDALKEGIFVAVSALRPELISYDETAIAKETEDGSGRPTLHKTTKLEIPNWRDPPRKWYSLDHQPENEIEAIKTEFFCSFSEITGMKVWRDLIAVIYITARDAQVIDGECRGKKTGIAVFEYGEVEPLVHRWLPDQTVLAGKTEEGLVLFTPRFSEAGLTPEIEIWAPR